ncbi:hypothetical protein [Paraburkholderia dipogonis]|uniref:hypothetical protein n=1 Tax=Paraburkholderia dipogonis TaxID=1211383 RepID=UPI0038B96A0B
MALPPQLPSDGSSMAIRRSLKVAGAEHPPVARVNEVRRPDGSILVVARDISQELEIRNTIINALIAGGLLCLGAGLAGALGLSVRQMRRVAQISDEEPGELADQINALAALAAKADIIFNNNWEDQGQRNARILMGILGANAIPP